MKLHNTRPEDRSRSGVDKPVWSDTLPACFRSEGFAEDLADSPGNPASAAQGRPLRPKWWGNTTLPALGLTLAGMVGVFAR